MAKVRLVAFRRTFASSATVFTSSEETTFELDLNEFPNISVNYQFSDIKNPETRKGSFSQTFKLPFTDNNNKFFENWYNYNNETEYFNTREKFSAAIYVGTVPQIEGYLQLKAVYKKGQYYEVVVFSNAADLFAVIGENSLKDVFKNENGSYDDELNHVFNAANLGYSWDGSSSSFQNTSLESLRDSDAGVQKVMYPMSVTQPGFYYPDPNGDGEALYKLSYTSGNQWHKCVDITQFKPAIQLKYLVKRILAKAGFTYTSTFLDGSYFGKLFMTTGGHLGASGTSVASSVQVPGGYMYLGKSENQNWGVLTGNGSDVNNYNCTYANSWGSFGGGSFDVQNDASNIYSDTYNYYTKKFSSMQTVELRHRIRATGGISAGVAPCDSTPAGAQTGSNTSGDVAIQYRIVEVNDTGVYTGNVLYESPQYDVGYGVTQSGYGATSAPFNSGISLPIDESIMPTGTKFKIWIRRTNWRPFGAGSFIFTLGHSGDFYELQDTNGAVQDINTRIRITWQPYELNVYNSTIDVPSNIDPEITQRDFLKDLIQRFNLIVVSDPNNASNIRIETYNDYISQGSIKYWTDKLDLDKEVIVKDTTSLQKKTINFTDQEDEDLYNKEFKENYPTANVYGHYKREELFNQFAKGELKNDSIFAPYINSKVFTTEEHDGDSMLDNMTVQYEFSYEVDEENGGVENVLKETKSKLFYYCGTPTTVIGTETATTVTYYMHSIEPVTNVISVHSFTTYPVCSPFDIVPSSNEFTLGSSTKSLYWRGAPPLVGEVTVFNWNEESNSWGGLYGDYWRSYLDGLYSTQARIMECYLNLSEVDIFNFKFNDEIFIKDAYWRIISISNYQVGEKASTKVTLLKVVDSLIKYEGCDYSVATLNGQNTFLGYYIWCIATNSGCTPTLTSTDLTGLYTNPQCCINVGGEVQWNNTVFAAQNLYLCQANAGSRPLRIQDLTNTKNIIGDVNIKKLTFGKTAGLNNPFVRGSDTNKYASNIMPKFGDDIVIKYNVSPVGVPKLYGENHRIILNGFTEGTTTGYAYPQGESESTKIMMPVNSTCRISAKATVTVIGGTDSTYTVGTTDSLSFYTVFRNANGVNTQIGTAGGERLFALNEVGDRVNLYIDISDGEIRFGLKDTQADTKRLWTLSVDLDVRLIPNLSDPLGTNYALFQNSEIINLQNYDLLLWN